MRGIGLIPRQRLKWIPAELRVRHEYCFFLHDECVRALKEYEAAQAHVVSVKLPSETIMAEFERVAAEEDPIEALRVTGFEKEARRVVLNHITRALVSDCLHHVYEGLRCLEKRKSIVAMNLLRKPLKDNLLYLAWMLGDEDGFYLAFTTGDPEKLTQKQLGNDRIEIFRKALAQTQIAGLIDPALLNDVLYNRKNPHGFELLFQHAVHLITVANIELRTAPENFNFVFKNPADDDSYEAIYFWLPTILLFLTHVIMGLFDRVHSMDKGVETSTFLRTMFGWLLLEHEDGSWVQEQLNENFAPHIKCRHCQATLQATRYNAMRIATTESFRCTVCRKKNDFPFSWLVSGGFTVEGGELRA